MSQSQKDSDVHLRQDSEGDLGGDDTKKDIEDDEKEDEEDEEDEEKNSDQDSDEDADGDPPTEELADREERLCSVEAEKAAERNFGEMCPEDLKVTKLTSLISLTKPIASRSYISRSFHWTLTWYVHFFF